MPKYQTSLPKVALPLSNGKQLKNDTGKIITFLSDLPENRIPGRTDSSLAIVCKLLRILRIFFADRSSSLKTMGPSASFRCPPSCFFPTLFRTLIAGSVVMTACISREILNILLHTFKISPNLHKFSTLMVPLCFYLFREKSLCGNKEVNI